MMFAMSIVNRTASKFLLLTLSLSAHAQVLLDVSWRPDVNGGYGNWNDAAHWNPAVVPNNDVVTHYNVSIGGNVGATLTTDVTIDQLNFTGGQILGAGRTLTINEEFNVNVTGFSQLGVGTIVLAPGSVSIWNGGDITFNDPVTIRNFGSLSFTHSSPVTYGPSVVIPSTPGIVNEAGGTFNKSSASQLTLNRPFENTGLFNHAQGTILYQGQAPGLRMTAGEYRLGPSATARGDMQFLGGTILAAGTFDPFGVLPVTSANFRIGLNPNAVGSVNFNNKQLSLTAGTLEFKLESGSSYDRIQNLAGWSVNGTALSLRLINNAQNTLQPSDILTLVNASFDNGVSFANVGRGQRLTTVDGLGSFLVDYPTGSGDLVLSDFQAVPEPEHVALATGLVLAGLALHRRFRVRDRTRIP